MGRQKKSLSLEDYNDFQQYRNAEDFTVDQLNEVIFMHGFSKIHRRPKAVLYDALSTVDLVNLPRSTLNDDLSPPYRISFSLKEARTDLEALNWLECPIVQSVKFVGSQESDCGRDCDVSARDFARPPSKIRRKRGRPRKSEASSGRDSEVAARDFAMPSWKSSRKRRRPRAKRMTRWRTAEFGFGFQPSGTAGGGDGGFEAGTVGGLGSDTSLFVDTYSWDWEVDFAFPFSSFV